MVSLKSAFKYKKYPEITFLFFNVYGKEISLIILEWDWNVM